MERRADILSVPYFDIIVTNMAKKGTLSLRDQRYETIQAHILDPENSPLPDNLREQFNRVLQVARLLDDYPDDHHIINIMMTKYRVSQTQLRHDIALAKELFKTNHTFDWDFWQAWQLKDQLELIRTAKLQGDLKAWNNAKKVLALLIGQKPEAVDDPRRMEKNVFNIQVNYNGQTMNIDLDKIKGLPSAARQEIIEQFYAPVDDVTADDIMNS